MISAAISYAIIYERNISMKNKICPPAPPPRRKELNDTPVKFCNEISRLFRAHMRENDPHDGVMSQQGAHLVLSNLAAYDGINQLELVRNTHLRAPTVSVILRRMEGEGLVTRLQDPQDKRAVRVYLTDKGKALDRKNIERIKELDKTALSGLSQEECDTLMSLLPKIRDNLLPDRKLQKEVSE